MIEAYALLAIFTVQILTMSVLIPDRTIRHFRAQAANLSAEHFAQLFPGADPAKTLERHLTRYRILNLGVTVLGLWLLGWIFNYTQRPDWDFRPVKSLLSLYLVAQMLAWVSGLWKHRKLLEQLLGAKRKATLQRRVLFDFVSPFSIFLAVLAYFLFVAFVIYVEYHPIGNIIGITLIYVFQAVFIYRAMHKKKFNPYETHAAREYEIGLGVKVMVYFCIAYVVHKSLKVMLVVLELQRWQPFELSGFAVFIALVGLMALAGTARRTEVVDLRSTPAR